MNEAQKDGTVCIVTERRLPNGESHLYGVFADEGEARRSYGAEVEGYEVTFEVVPLWVVRP